MTIKTESERARERERERQRETETETETESEREVAEYCATVIYFPLSFVNTRGEMFKAKCCTTVSE